jgi:hypothetical protein
MTFGRGGRSGCALAAVVHLLVGCPTLVPIEPDDALVLEPDQGVLIVET